MDLEVHSPPCAPFSGARRVAKNDEVAMERRLAEAEAVVGMVEGTGSRWADDRLRPAVVLFENSPKLLDKTGFAPEHGFSGRILDAVRKPFEAARARGVAAARFDAVVMDPGRPASRRRCWMAARLRDGRPGVARGGAPHTQA